jgi:sugar phosphate isomerase/epimerase
VQFTQMHGPIHGTSYTNMVLGLSVDTFRELLHRSLRTAAILGIPWVVLHPTNISLIEYERTIESIAYNREFIHSILPYLEKTGVGVALENVMDRNFNGQEKLNRRFGSVPEELCDLIDAIGHPLVGGCWDTGNGHVQGLPQGSSIRMLGKRLKALHIQDNDGMKDPHLLPFYGTINWTESMAALRDIGYSGDFTYEVHNAIRILPDSLRGTALKSAVEIAQYLIEVKEGN